MPRNGSGTYSLPSGNPVVNGTTISSATHNSTMSDIATAITQSISSTGVTTPIANLPMGGFKHTGVANATARDQYSAAGQVQDGSYLWGGTVGGTADALTATLTPAITAYVAGQTFKVKVGAASNLTTTPTINFNGVGAKTIVKRDGTALSAGDLPADTIVELVYDGTNMRLDSIAASNLLTNSKLNYSARTSNTILSSSDVMTYIDITSGTFSQTFNAAATLGNGWWCIYRNSGSGEVTLDPNGAETIDGLASYVMYKDEVRLISCNGTNFTTVILKPFYKKYTSAGSYTFVMPPGYSNAGIDLVGGGGGGGSGRRGAAGSTRSGGAAGGAPGRIIKDIKGIPAGTSITVTVGAAGTGGAAISVNNTAGNDGTAGGNTSFGTYYTAYGGAAGKGGDTSNVATSGSGMLSAGSSTNVGGSLNGGTPTLAGLGKTTLCDNVGFGGGGASASISGCTEYGGAGCASIDTTGTARINAGSSMFGVSAASHGGWITSGDAMPATAPDAGLNGTSTTGGGATGGTCGASPTAGGIGGDATIDNNCGNPGAGGGSSTTTAASAGGDGGYPGGPGGGGGASVNGNNSGAGGNGKAGRAIIWGIA